MPLIKVLQILLSQYVYCRNYNEFSITYVFISVLSKLQQIRFLILVSLWMSVSILSKLQQIGFLILNVSMNVLSKSNQIGFLILMYLLAYCRNCNKLELSNTYFSVSFSAEITVSQNCFHNLRYLLVYYRNYNTLQISYTCISFSVLSKSQ